MTNITVSSITPLGLTKTLDAEQSAGVGPHLLLVLSLASKAAHTHGPGGQVSQLIRL